MKMLVLAGGFGTRLQTTVSGIPKALAPIDNQPFLFIQLKNWISQGIHEFTFLLHYQNEAIISFLQSNKSGILKNCNINWVIEKTPMGTGGAIVHAIRQLNLNGEFLLINADTWISTGINKILHTQSPTIAVIYKKNINRYGQVKFDSMNQVIQFTEKNESNSKGWINSGLSYLHTDFFLDLNDHPFSLEQDFYEILIKKRVLNVIKLKTEFIDIGIPADYFEFCNWYKSKSEK